jgi:hypothetical protein
VAITPNEAFATDEQERKLIAKLEAEIDLKLKEDCGKWGQGIVTLNHTATKRIREEIMRRYREAGWHVEYHDNQFDGASLTFRPVGP